MKTSFFRIILAENGLGDDDDEVCSAAKYRRKTTDSSLRPGNPRETGRPVKVVVKKREGLRVKGKKTKQEIVVAESYTTWESSTATERIEKGRRDGWG